MGLCRLTVGSNDESTFFSGIIQDGGINQGTGGALTKAGTGTLKRGAAEPSTLTIQSSLTCKGDSTYSYRLNTQKARSDEVIANGVTIESGEQLNFQAIGQGRVRAGKVFTALSNTSATPIGGAFANLPDGSTLRAGRNTLQVSYAGGDGNDLTLTVAP